MTSHATRQHAIGLCIAQHALAIHDFFPYKRLFRLLLEMQQRLLLKVI
jgi:hypothetical protein